MSRSRDDNLLSQWTEEQDRQSSIAIFRDESLPFDVSGSSSKRTASPVQITREDLASLTVSGLDRVAGFDISFPAADGDEGVAVLALLSFPELKLVKSITRRISLEGTPYIHSFLSFRESDHYVALLRELEDAGDSLPQILFVDGNGRWHPRQSGSAVAVGVKTGLPTIGIAKDYHPIHPSDAIDSTHALKPYPPDFMMSQKGIRKACQDLLQHRGDWLALPGLSRVDFWGAALLASPARSATNPIFVSSGHRVSLETSVRVALLCSTEGKIPEPIRQADLIGRAEVKRIWT
ncbi:hypothetical protein JCM3766R1_001490 [Sporobolomyces carnicolor]